MKKIKHDFNLVNSIVCGCIGPRGDGYVVDKKMTVK
jgi:hypothetical protein